MINLRGLVLSQYKTLTSFADAIGWSKNKTYRVVNQITEPTIDEIVHMTNHLQIDSKEAFMDIFFKSLSTKWTSSAS